MANYTINNLPNVADEVVNADILPIWKTDEEKTAQVPVSTLMAGTKVIFASSTTVTGNTLASGDVLRIMFTSALTGSDTETGLTITYNSVDYAVKVCKQGALADFVATEIDSAYYYLQAYTTLELAFNGGAFVIIGNPVVLSSDDYTIYADGQRALPSNNLGKDLYSIYNTQTSFVYGSKVVKSGINVTTSGTTVDISDVLSLFGITTGYYSFILRIVTRATATYMYDEYIISYNSNGSFVIMINSNPNGMSRVITPSAPTSSSITLTSSGTSCPASMLTFEPIGYY